MSYTNTLSVRSALDIDALLTANRISKPFLTCYQCRKSRFILDAVKARTFVCKKPKHRAEVISPSDLIAGCPFAERYTNADVLANGIRLALSRASLSSSTIPSPLVSAANDLGRGCRNAAGKGLL